MKKEGITPLNWALSIAGILVLTCLIVLPPVFRVVFKEKPEPVDDTKPVIETMTCSKKNFVVENYFQNETIVFKYVSNRINTYTKDTDMTFDDIATYERVKGEYGRLSSAYNLIKTGVNYVLSPDDGLLKISIKESYNLGLFKATSITIPGDTEPTQVTSEYTRNDLVSEVKDELVGMGYSCK